MVPASSKRSFTSPLLFEGAPSRPEGFQAVIPLATYQNDPLNHSFSLGLPLGVVIPQSLSIHLKGYLDELWSSLKVLANALGLLLSKMRL